MTHLDVQVNGHNFRVVSDKHWLPYICHQLHYGTLTDYQNNRYAHDIVLVSVDKGGKFVACIELCRNYRGYSTYSIKSIHGDYYLRPSKEILDASIYWAKLHRLDIESGTLQNTECIWYDDTKFHRRNCPPNAYEHCQDNGTTDRGCRPGRFHCYTGDIYPSRSYMLGKSFPVLWCIKQADTEGTLVVTVQTITVKLPKALKKIGHYTIYEPAIKLGGYFLIHSILPQKRAMQFLSYPSLVIGASILQSLGKSLIKCKYVCGKSWLG